MSRDLPRPRWGYAVLALYLLGALVLVGWPDGWAVNRLIVRIYFTFVGWGLQPPFPLDWFSFILNVLLLVPAAALAVWLFPRVPWWLWVLVAALASTTVEVAQSFIGREPNPMDVVANTLGALLGSAVAALLLRGRTRR